MTIIFDLRSGVSGDMLLSALLQYYSSTNDPGKFIQRIEDAASVMSRTTVKVGEVVRSGENGYTIEVQWDPWEKHSIHGIEMVEFLNRGLQRISANDRICKMARRMMKNILEAEMIAHECRTIEDVHLHETGTPDTLVDIIGISILFDELELDGEWVKGTSLSLGGGKINTSHGELDIPVPAVRAMIGSIPVRYGPVNGELATPTGVAAINSFIEIWMEHGDLGDDGEIKGRKLGSGAGKREYPSFSNMLHIWEVPS
jgi:hypothetical protein